VREVQWGGVNQRGGGRRDVAESRETGGRRGEQRGEGGVGGVTSRRIEGGGGRGGMSEGRGEIKGG